MGIQAELENLKRIAEENKRKMDDERAKMDADRKRLEEEKERNEKERRERGEEELQPTPDQYGHSTVMVKVGDLRRKSRGSIWRTPNDVVKDFVSSPVMHLA